MTELINETHKTCPICLEKYDREIGRLKDGICNSFYESDCNHYCCCMCWDTIYRQKLEKYCCPICRRDITDWIIYQYEEEEEEKE